jgi:hypothetical protein
MMNRGLTARISVQEWHVLLYCEKKSTVKLLTNQWSYHQSTLKYMFIKRLDSSEQLADYLTLGIYWCNNTRKVDIFCTSLLVWCT